MPRPMLCRTVLLWLTVCVALPGGMAMADEGGNLLQNPALRRGIVSPTAWGFNTVAGNRASWQASANGASRSVLLEAGGQDWAGLTSRSVQAEPGETFTVAAWMRAIPGREPTDVDRLYVRFFDRGRFVGQLGPPLAGVKNDWQLISGLVTAPEKTFRADVSVQLRSKTTVRIASLCLARGDRTEDIESLLPTPPGVVDWRPVDPQDQMPADTNENGLPDALEAFLGITPADDAVSIRRTRDHTTSLQTPTGYREDNDLKVDTIIVAGNSEDNIRSWAAMGYEPHVMVGFRAGADYLGREHNGILGRDETQTASDGTPLTCGPGSYYMVPTENRRNTFREYFADAVRRGAVAACPEEPEFFSRAGYSEAFKREWQDYYGEPWQDQTTSVDARFKSEKLKVDLERRLLQACYEGARSVSPDVTRFLLAHSPLSYTAWGITFGHQDAIAGGEVDAMVAQVWTGTARSAITYEGQTRQRTFENAYLEYASTLGLVRGLDIDLWFLMDPLEDNPDRSMEDYEYNYHRTLVASLLFPEVDRFETMPWPTRIFGRVPDEFATEICSIINLLSDMHNQKQCRFEAGSSGIGTFLADTAMWQRGTPHPSDMNCFYGITLPLLMRGVPVEVPNLERASDPGYLDRFRLLFVSYDMLKPVRPEINEALAAWTRRGGCLVVLGGEDAYNAVDMWWRKKGFESPQDHLLSLCGFDVSRRQTIEGLASEDEWQVVARTNYTGTNLENQTVETIDLTPFLKSGTALLKFEDSQKGDGWGALITRIWAEGTRDGKPVKLDITPNTPEEQDILALNADSQVNDVGWRFCDGTRYAVYAFEFDPGTRATARVEVGNQYLIRASAGRNRPRRVFRATGESRALGVDELPMTLSQPVVTYGQSGAIPLYADGDAALLSEKQVGEGTVLFFGASPSWFAQSAEGAAQMRALTRYAIEEKLGDTFREQGYLKLERGRYVIAKTFDEPIHIAGRYVNVLNSELPMVADADLGPDELAVLYDIAPDLGSEPRMLFASSCVEWKSGGEGRVRLILSGAEGTVGACRLLLGEAHVQSLRAIDADGKPVEVQQIVDGDTVLLKYANQPFGIAVEVTTD